MNEIELDDEYTEKELDVDATLIASHMNIFVVYILRNQCVEREHDFRSRNNGTGNGQYHRH